MSRSSFNALVPAPSGSALGVGQKRGHNGSDSDTAPDPNKSSKRKKATASKPRAQKKPQKSLYHLPKKNVKKEAEGLKVRRCLSL